MMDRGKGRGASDLGVRCRRLVAAVSLGWARKKETFSQCNWVDLATQNIYHTESTPRGACWALEGRTLSIE